MNHYEFVQYLYHNKGEALVGKPDTLEAARQMEEKGFLTQIGVKDGKPMFRVTQSGDFFVEYSMKRMGETTKAKAKNFLKDLGKAMDSYIQAYKVEHPVGMQDIRNTFGGMSGIGEARVELPSIEPMRLDAPATKPRLEDKSQKKRKYVVVDGVRYYRDE